MNPIKTEISELTNTKFTFIIPVKEEEGNILKVLSGFKQFKYNIELIFIVSRESFDTFREIEFQSRQEFYSNLKILFKYQDNSGKADAVIQGFKISTGEIISIFDADCSVSHFDAIQIALKSLEVNAVVTGNRLDSYLKNSGRMFHFFYNKIITLFFNFRFKTNLMDVLCGSKAFPKLVVQNILKLNDCVDNRDRWGDLLFLSLSLQSGLELINLNVTYHDREWGNSKISSFFDGVSLLLFILRR